MRILLADDHILFRDALLQFITALKPNWSVVTASSFDEAIIPLKRGETFDLVLLDVRMPGMNGLEGLKTLIDEFPNQKTAILSGTAEDHQVREAMGMGARAYFPKTLQGKVLVSVIELVMLGERYIPLDDSGTKIMPAYYGDTKPASHNSEEETPEIKETREKYLSALTRREKEVLAYLGQGLSNKDIARVMDLQVATVKLHVGGVCKKLDANNRTQAALIAHQYNLIDIDPEAAVEDE